MSAPQPPLSRPKAELIQAMETLLVEQNDSRRKPTVAASVLALIVELYQRREVFPKRALISKMLGCSVFGIDAALSSAMARGYICLDIRMVKGRVTNRPSTSKQRFYVPSREVLDRSSYTSVKPSNAAV
jgi:hypothetical protein